ncbi:zinc finger HIT domain-containing protein 1-like [Convolutriloba macropyga]|uniref:zinc finger HIT domain-containing protein 1-like n=1 Tax=Convolutriloba macropyga TaxID=536237 RepID=UPI003F51B4FD
MSVVVARESERQKIVNEKKILDNISRERRLERHLDSLEKDNFQEDPHANLIFINKKMLHVEGQEDKSKSAKGRKRKIRGDHFKQRFRKTLQNLVEEEAALERESPNYFTCIAPPSKKPAKKLCSVCGFPSAYNCVQCGFKFCSLDCQQMHKDTRCLKWTA